MEFMMVATMMSGQTFAQSGNGSTAQHVRQALTESLIGEIRAAQKYKKLALPQLFVLQ